MLVLSKQRRGGPLTLTAKQAPSLQPLYRLSETDFVSLFPAGTTVLLAHPSLLASVSIPLERTHAPALPLLK